MPTTHGERTDVHGTDREWKNPGLSGCDKIIRSRFQPTIQHRGADECRAMSAVERPSQSLLLGHASIGYFVDAAFCP